MIVDRVKEIMPPFFLVKIPKKEQRERLEKIGKLYYPPEYVFMKRGMQCAEIVGIGKDAHDFFPEAKIGDILICHHMVEGKSFGMRDKFFMVEEDENWTYYCVTAFCYNGDRNNTFGVWNGEEIIPSKDYVFLSIDPTPVSDLPAFVFEPKGMAKIITTMPMELTPEGLVVPKYRRKTRVEMKEKQDANTAEIKRLSRWLHPKLRPDVAAPKIHQLEAENTVLSNEMNRLFLEPHALHAFNNALLKTVDPDLRKGDKVFVLNAAAHYQVEFMGTEYLVAESKYVQFKMPQINKEPEMSIS